MRRRLIIEGTAHVVADAMREASSVRQRMRGLLGQGRLAPGEALLLSPCKQVHTIGMKYPIDVVFCDRSWRVTGILAAMRPGRVSRVEWRARHTIELPEGGASNVNIGDTLLVEPPRL